jgi:hypothetical protein
MRRRYAIAGSVASTAGQATAGIAAGRFFRDKIAYRMPMFTPGRLMPMLGP